MKVVYSLELKQLELGQPILFELKGKLNFARTWWTIQKAGCPKRECHWFGEVRSPTKTNNDEGILLKAEGNWYILSLLGPCSRTFFVVRSFTMK